MTPKDDDDAFVYTNFQDAEPGTWFCEKKSGLYTLGIQCIMMLHIFHI
jgi:hypothetical protein